eukprot:523579_1
MPIRSDYLFHITKDSWEHIASYLHYQSLINVKITCKEVYFIINNSEYLAYQTLIQFIKYNVKYINALYAKCIGDDLDLPDPSYGTDLNEKESLQIFSPLCFDMMTLFKGSTLFQFYSRLISYNWKIHLLSSHSDHDNFPLINVHNKMSDFQLRNLNNLETKFFKTTNHWNNGHIHHSLQYTGFNPIYNFETFIDHLKIHSHYHQWKDIIFNHQHRNGYFFLAGGMALKCLLKYHQEVNHKNMKDVDFFACNMSFKQFIDRIHQIKYTFIAKGFPAIMSGHSKYWLDDQSKVQNLFVNFSGNAKTSVNNDISHDSIYNKRQYEYRIHQWGLAGWIYFNECIFPGLHLCKIQMHHTHPLRQYENALITYRINDTTYRGTGTAGLYVNDIDDAMKNNHRLMDRIGELNEHIRWQYAEKHITEQNSQNSQNWQQLQFIHISEVSKPWSVLHVFDLDCCQVGFDGHNVLSTHAFMQSINTQTLLNYKFINNIHLQDLFTERTRKYCHRGFNVISPIKFDVEETDDEKWEQDYQVLIFWEHARSVAMQSVFIKDGNHAFKTYGGGKGSFGLNNDSLGVRKQFMNFLINRLPYIIG